MLVIPSRQAILRSAHRRRWLLPGALLSTALLVASCAAVPTRHAAPPSTALADWQTTPAGKMFEQVGAEHPGDSGTVLLRQSRSAFTARIALTELAQRTLDVQYYIWESDTTGLILAERLLRAADRGVRVRILVDDNNLGGRDSGVAALDAHPNVEVRVFNPFAHRNRHALDFLFDFGRVNHRMHNKVMVMDNAVAIVGGRNIGDHYFGIHTEANFRDLDVGAAGPVVREVSQSFDEFWNGDSSVPISALTGQRASQQDLAAAREAMRAAIATEDYPFPLDEDLALLRKHALEIRDQMVWAPARVLYDAADTVDIGVASGKVAQSLGQHLNGLQRELLIESAYFVPQSSGVQRARELIDRGVRIRVLTNSLASNDVAAAHAGYEKHRRELIEEGVDVHELRPDSQGLKKKWSITAGDSRASLHTKAVVFDRQSAFIGSFNLDPRSGSINTEIGLLIESPQIAEQVAAYMDEGASLQNSYRVLIDDAGDLVWETELDGQLVRYHSEPNTSFLQRLTADFIKLLPVQSQL